MNTPHPSSACVNTSKVSPFSKAIVNHSKDVASEIKPTINNYIDKHNQTKNKQKNNSTNLSFKINEDELYEKIMIELEGTSADSMIKVKGLKNQLIGEITSIRNEIQKIKIGVKKSGQILVSTLQ